MNLLCLDVGGTLTKIAVINTNVDIVQEEIIPTPKQGENTTNDFLISIVEKYSSKVSGVAFSIPGAVTKDGEMFWKGAVRDLDCVYINQQIESLFRLKSIFANDANCFAMAEHFLGAAKGSTNSITVAIGTGVGSGIVIDNKLYIGNKSMAGEIGLIPLDRSINKFQLEDNCFSNSGSSRSLVHHAKRLWLDVENAKEVFELYENGDEQAIKAVTFFIDSVSVGIYNMIVTLAPDVIVVGGGVSVNANFQKSLFEKLDVLLPEWRAFSDVRIANFANNSGVVGAAITWFENEGVRYD